MRVFMQNTVMRQASCVMQITHAPFENLWRIAAFCICSLTAENTQRARSTNKFDARVLVA